MNIFAYQDDEWMRDEVLPICIGDCTDLPDDTPMPGIELVATPEK